MLAMHYALVLDDEHDMTAIRARAAEKAPRYDDYPGLAFKAFVMTERGEWRRGEPARNLYGAFYLWHDEETATAFLRSEKWWTMAKYVTMANYTGDVIMVAFNLDFWNGLAPADQEMIAAAVRRYGDRNHAGEKRGEAEVLAKLESEGMQVTQLSPRVQGRDGQRLGQVPGRHRGGDRGPGRGLGALAGKPRSPRRR